MKNFSCNNEKKRILCVQECSTCIPRSFEQVHIQKYIEDELVDFIPSEFWFHEKNAGVLPRHVLRSSNKSFSFICNICNHVFELKLDDCTIRGNWCSYCAGKKLCSENDCTTCFERSAASLEIPLSDENRKQGLESDPRRILKNSHAEYFFDCLDCGHPFRCRMDCIARGHWCSYCNGDLICENSDYPDKNHNACEFCFNNSLASNYRSKDITVNTPTSIYNEEGLDPRFIRKSSRKKIWFTCSEPACKGLKHHFEARINNVTCNNTWCPYCSSPPKKLCNETDFETCETCFKKSFASSPMSDFVDYDAEYVNIKQIFKSSHKKLHFICDKKECGFKFVSTPNRITNGNSWCPNCKKKTEAIILKHLQKRYPGYKIIKELRADFCINPDSCRHYPYDFYIPEMKLIIEVDGPQHFFQVSNWKSPEETQKIDRYKEICACTNDISVIRLLQTDIFYDKNDWKKLFDSELNHRVENKPKVVKIYEGTIKYTWFD